jgi:3-dehydroquinate dehydratase-2
MPLRSVLILNGPNLNLLGTREPEIYGTTTLAEIEARCRAVAEPQGCVLDFRQSNHEGELVTWVQQATQDALILNAAAYTHTSVALHDALKNYNGRIVEVHLSNPHKREPFRHLSYISSVAEAIICGCGSYGYEMALHHLMQRQ